MSLLTSSIFALLFNKVVMSSAEYVSEMDVPGMSIACEIGFTINLIMKGSNTRIYSMVNPIKCFGLIKINQCGFTVELFYDQVYQLKVVLNRPTLHSARMLEANQTKLQKVG